MNQVNQWVMNLLRTYQYSKIGNSDNRGLDTQFAKDTYIPTKLDQELLPDIISAKFKAVFLTGNAGDGKTAFLEKVYQALMEKGGKKSEKDSAGWIVEYKNKIYKACYDASESEMNGKLSSNQRLVRLYSHLGGYSEPVTDIIVLTAINDGKLHAFFHDYKKNFQWFSDAIFSAIFSNYSNPNNSVCIVNLKDRALIDLDFDKMEESSLLDKTLKIFTNKEKWSVCLGCDSNRICPIFYNARTLGSEEYSNKIRARIKLLFTISHLRKQRHNTMRNIRSALSYIITSNLTCEDVHKIENSEANDASKHFYFNAIFNSPDDSLVELNEIDPSQKNYPRLDKTILFSQRTNQIKKITDLLFTRDSITNFDYPTMEEVELIEYWRRRLYFEADDELILGVDEFTEIEKYYDLLPYSYLKSFLKHLKKEGNIFKLRQEISKGVAQLEGIRDIRLAQKFILIKVSQNIKEGLTVCRKFPIEEFEVFTLMNDRPYLESIPNLIILKQKESGIQTKINLDVYEIIRRMAEGQLPSSEEQKPVMDELTDFKSRLHRSQAKDLLLIESNGIYHHISQVDNQILRNAVISEVVNEN